MLVDYSAQYRLGSLYAKFPTAVMSPRDPTINIALQTLRASESRYRRLFETARSGILLLNGDTAEIEEVNPCLIEMLGLSRAELLGKKLWEVVAFADNPKSKEMFRELQTKGCVRDEDFWLRTAGGTQIEVEFVSNTFECDGTKLIWCDVRDITERKRAEEQLRAAEEQFRGLVEQQIAGVYIIQDGRFIYVNPRCAEIVGRGSTNELIGTDPVRWVAEADQGLVAEHIRSLLDGETSSVKLEFGVQRRDGSATQVGAHAARTTREGRPAIIGLVQDISEKKRGEDETRRHVEQLKIAFMGTVKVATIISEIRDPYTAGHERRVAELAVAIGDELWLDSTRLEGLRVGGHLHDIGKMTVPLEILSKPGKLSALEMQLIRGHAQAGYDVLKDVAFPWPVAQIALQHHERVNGSGYPQGLKGEAILLEARIMAVADVVEAMSSHRPYRAGLGIETALAEIERGRGTLYDANAANACLCLFRERRYQLNV